MPLIPTLPGQGAGAGAAETEKPAAGAGVGLAATDIAQPVAPVGVSLTSKADPEPGLNYPVIGYRNALAGAAAISNDANSATAANVLTYTTWDRFYGAAASSQLTLTLTGAEDVDYIAIAGHNLALVGGQITAETTDTVGGAWAAVPGAVIQSGKSTAGMLLFASRTVAQIRLTLSGATGPVGIAVVFAGQRLTMQRPSYAGVVPSSLTETVQRMPKVSDTGQFLGTQIIRKGVKAQAQFRHLTDAWYRANFEPFAQHSRSLPFFYAWNPEEDPQGVIYAFAAGDMEPEKMGIRDMLSVSWEMMGHR